MASQDRASHWDEVFETKSVDEVSWYEPDPATSGRLLEDAPGSVIDVGAGASTLVDKLLAAGRSDVTLLDISREALEVTRARLGDRAGLVTFVVADLREWEPDRQFDAWHDRAVFHFLTVTEERGRYVDLLTRAVRPGGSAVIATFAEDGPTQCSGLPTARYRATELADLFAPDFELVHDERTTHATPWGAEQPFTWVRLRRTS